MTSVTSELSEGAHNRVGGRQGGAMPWTPYSSAFAANQGGLGLSSSSPQKITGVFMSQIEMITKDPTELPSQLPQK